MRPPITSVKHIVQRSPTDTALGAIENISVAFANDQTGNTNVKIGSVIKAVYVELWFIGTDQQTTSTTMTVEKKPSGLTAMSNADSANLGQYDNKNNIFFTSQGIIGDANSNPVPLHRGWIKIPKGKQRWSKGDLLVINVTGLTGDITTCGVFIFKEYF